MKQTIKLLSLILLTAILAVSLTSCAALDTMREAHAFYGEDETILYNDATYYRLPECADLTVSGLYAINVTESDVPLLLSGILGDSYEVTNGGEFLERSTYSSDIVYCRSDRFESVKAMIEKGYTMNHLCFRELLYNDDFETYHGYVLIDTKTEAVLQNTVETQKPMLLPGSGMKNETIIEINRCSEDMLFQSHAFDLRVSGGVYYVTVTDSLTNETAYYRIADSDLAVIRATFDQNR